MVKECADHGSFKDTVWSDVDMYLKAESWAVDGYGVSNPQIEATADQCPDACGLCTAHLSTTCLANIDLTNRCNLKCPVCFANANDAGYVFEPSFDEIVKMLEILRAEEPVPTPGVQFAGGEPTIHPRFLDIVRKARELGFPQIQVATNGILLAHRNGFAQEMFDAGMNTIYLQFDGLREEDYIAARGVPLLQTKIKAIEACRNTTPVPLATLLVPTIIKTINDDQVGPILDFAIENRDVVRGVNYQPVAFTGRIDQEARERERYTLSDLAIDLESQTDFLSREDFYAVPSVTAISRLVTAIHEPKMAFTTHPHCGLATFLIVDQNGKATPITRMVDVEGLLRRMWKLADDAETTMGKFILGMAKKVSSIKDEEARRDALYKRFDKYFGEFIKVDDLPGGVSLQDVLFDMTYTPEKDPLAKFAWSTCFIGGMHFQDNYNYDIDRVMRCVIHYATPDGRIIPFCAYNGGPTYREEVEKKFSIPLEEWRARHADKEDYFQGDSD
jgi:uncharacterized radical SAM superfamily Fe-S cluster-containing enzyme